MKQSGLCITVECNLQITDFLGVTFDLRPANIIHTEMLTTNYSELTNSQPTDQLSRNKYHRFSQGQYRIQLAIKNTSKKLYPHIIMHLQIVASRKTLNSRKHPLQERTVTQEF